MNVVYCGDDNYAEIMGISIISLLRNNAEADEIKVFILNDNISAENIYRLNTIFEHYNRHVLYVDVSNFKVPDSVVSERWSKSAFTRLYMASLLPQDIDKLLYLDCDVIIKNSLVELWNTKIDDYILAGVKDCISNGYKSNLGIDRESFYINSGILLINMSKWRTDNIEEAFLLGIDKYQDVLRYPDQDLINGVLNNQILLLPLKYNSCTILSDFLYADLIKYRKPNNYYDEDEVKSAVANPVIIHFTSSFLSLRPWIKGCKHIYVDEYLKYKHMSPWFGAPLRGDNRSLYKKLYEKVYRMMPLPMAVGFSGWLHSTVVPWYKSFRNIAWR